MSLITPDFGLLFWMTIVFLIVLFILWNYPIFFWGPSKRIV